LPSFRRAGAVVNTIGAELAQTIDKLHTQLTGLLTDLELVRK
jgi:hypothetical protein